MEKFKNIVFATLNGAVSFFVMFYFIPLFFMKGVEDYIWILLMLVLPLVLSILLLRVFSKCENKHILYSIAIECILAIVLYSLTGSILGFELGSFSKDLFDWIGYIVYVFGWIAASSALQYIVLKMIHKIINFKENILNKGVNE